MSQPGTDTIRVVCKQGRLSFIYTDRLAALLKRGDFTITRVSQVEPTAAGQWTADLSAVYGGPVLGPFDLRQEALDAEIQWLREHQGL